jgi:transposase
MLDTSKRTAILQLASQGLGTRRIAKLLKVSRGTVKDVVASRQERPPPVERPSVLAPHAETIGELTQRCQGNLVRVHEELGSLGVTVAYSTLTAFIRREAPPPKVPVGAYDFQPAEEMQHDTSPHEPKIAGKWIPLQTASLVLCFSRVLFFQLYVRFTRFEAKVFLTEALRFLGGSARVAMIDNTSVIRAYGTGADMVPAPEMVAFSQRFGFEFRAHDKGHADRKGRVEAPFRFIQKNFLAGRNFSSLRQLNEEARTWCKKVNASYKKHIRAIPQELFAIEKPQLKALPVFIPEPEKLLSRLVDPERLVNVECNRYSVPTHWIGRQVQVRVKAETIEIDGKDKTVVHERIPFPLGHRLILPEHRYVRGTKPTKASCPEEADLSRILPGIASYVARLKASGKRAPTLLLRRLLRMVREYPHGSLQSAIDEAERFGLLDLDRLERMVLSRIASDYFPRRDDE